MENALAFQDVPQIAQTMNVVMMDVEAVAELAIKELVNTVSVSQILLNVHQTVQVLCVGQMDVEAVVVRVIMIMYVNTVNVYRNVYQNVYHLLMNVVQMDVEALVELVIVEVYVKMENVLFFLHHHSVQLIVVVNMIVVDMIQVDMEGVAVLLDIKVNIKQVTYVKLDHV